jgi:hypothetical protein
MNNLQLIKFYSSLLEIERLCEEARNLGGHLECPDSGLMDALEGLPDVIEKHLAGIKVQVMPEPKRSDFTREQITKMSLLEINKLGMKFRKC